MLFASGASALIYQVVWMRMLVATFGATVYAMGAVVTAFMAGLALGSYLFGRFVDRAKIPPLMLYGILQLGIAAFALLFPLVLSGITAAHTAVFRQFSASFGTLTAVRFALCFVAIALPTTLMGATFPVAVKHATVRLPSLGSVTSTLYSANTFGGMLGAFLAGFFMIELLGIRLTTHAAAALNIAVGLAAVAGGARLARLSGPTRAPQAATPPKDAREAAPTGGAKSVGGSSPAISRAEARLVLLGAGIAGLAALSNEVLWTRIMVYVLGNFVHSFTLVLMSFLLGIALGSAIISRRIDRPGLSVRTFAYLQLAIGVAAVVLIPLFAPLIGLRESFLDRLSGAGGVSIEVSDPWWPYTLWKMGIAFAMMLVPTLLMGASLPLAIKLYARSERAVGRGVGEAYATNTAGAIVGSFLASFVLIGVLGVRVSALATASLSVALGIALLWLSPARRAPGGYRRAATLSGAAAVLIGFLAIPDDVFVRMYATAERDMRLIYFNESTGGTVTVHEAASGNRVIDINGLNVAGTKFGFLATQKLQAHFPILMHPDPRSIMQIGFGSGGTCRSVTQHTSIERVDCVEISPAVVEASKTYFADMNREVLNDPRVTLVIEDARNFVLATDRRYDVILSDSIHPRYVGNGNLYTLEYFELCASRLGDNGILSFWLPTYLLSVDEYKTIVRTLQRVFPHIVIWYMNNTVEAYSVAMGSRSPLVLDLERVRRVLEVEGVRDDLEVVRMADPIAIADCIAVHGDAVAAFVGSGPLNTEDKPIIEFRAPRNMIRERGEWMNLRELARHRTFPEGTVVNWGADEAEAERELARMRRFFDATIHVIVGHLHHIMRDLRAELAAYARAVEINPEDTDAPYLAERAVRILRRQPVD
ncbi:MAG: fused MFS/spermidine synthase [Candidatus Eisenbacteria bacterium]|nr:fused MFS/spermidine synthase [Candidatus Eisenbacteria bacterium]